MIASFVFVILAVVSSVQATSGPKCCAADRCFADASFPATYSPTVSAFCKKYIDQPISTATKTKTVVATSIKTQSRPTITKSVTKTTTTTLGSVCDASTTITLPTTAYYKTRTASPSDTTSVTVPKEKGGYVVTIPASLTANCDKGGPTPIQVKVSSACLCYLTPETKTITTTSTKVITAKPAPPTTTTVSVKSTVTVRSCTSTSTSSSIDVTCGIPSPSAGAQGSISCTQPSAPQETAQYLRIEGNDSEGTIFEQCIASSPREITTPSGGTHLCDGTNDGANPNPGATCTTQLDEAATEQGFPYDGSYNDQFQDYFITSISATTQTTNQFWGLLMGFQFTPTGGCQTEIDPTMESLWAFDAFNKVGFLRISPDYAAVTLGSTGSVEISVTDGSTGQAVGGADFGEANVPETDAEGHTEIVIPSEPGCYQYKAFKDEYLRSNAFYLTVLPAE